MSGKEPSMMSLSSSSLTEARKLSYRMSEPNFKKYPPLVAGVPSPSTYIANMNASVDYADSTIETVKSRGSKKTNTSSSISGKSSLKQF